MQRINATYLIETPLELETAASVLAGEQSSGTFVAVPGETEQLRDRFAARVESVTPLECTDAPSLPGSDCGGAGFRRGHVKISWSVENIGYNLPTLISTLQGNLFELRQFSGLKLLDVKFPPSFDVHFHGPVYGVSGTRKLSGVYGRPILGTIIKPSIGLAPEETAALVKRLVDAGIDFIKDDELMASPANSKFDERVEAVMRVINDHAFRTGKKVMYAFNISDEIDPMLAHYDTVVRHGGTCVMVSLNSVGVSGVKKICDQGSLAVHGHRNGWGMLTRHPLLGIDFKAYQKIWRLAGVDQIHVNGIQNKFWESDDSVVRSIQACQEPMLDGFEIMPVVSSGQWGGQAPETYARTRTIDLMYLAGGGILAHPDGPAAGIEAIQQAWEAAVAGISLDEAAAKSPALLRATEKFQSQQELNSPAATTLS